MRKLWTAFNAGLMLAIAIPCVTHAQTDEKTDLSKQPTLYVVGYAHLDTEWRWEYPQVIDEYPGRRSRWKESSIPAATRYKTH